MVYAHQRAVRIVSDDGSLGVESNDLRWLGAEETLLEKVESAAHVNLANIGADFSEISYAGGNWRWDCTVKVCNTENVDITAVGSARSANCRCGLTSQAGSWCGYRAGDEAAEEDGDE